MELLTGHKVILRSVARRVVALFRRATQRRLVFLSPPLIALAGATAFIVLLGSSAATIENQTNMIRVLLQIVATILGVNILGLTINTNQFGQSTSIRKLVSDTEGATAEIDSTYYNAHPRDQALQRAHRITALVKSAPSGILMLRNEQKAEDYYVYRPFWDGVWYQISRSPFAEHSPAIERTGIELLHEATLCAIQVLRVARDMRRFDCGLLSEDRGSNGSRWFCTSLRKIQKSDELGMAQQSPVTIRLEKASHLINLAIASNHYMREELQEHTTEVNWQPHQLTGFLCFYIEHVKWMGFLWVKLQMLRLANIFARQGAWPKELPQATLERLGIGKIKSARNELQALAKIASAEFGVANRFWLVRQSAIPGLGWAMAFLFVAAILWPAGSLLLGANAQSVILSVTYGLGVLALLESLVFASGLIWARRIDPALPSVGSRPPG
jgi:hypothetical protein